MASSRWLLASVLLVAFAAGDARGQAVAHPNQIAGTIGFRNVEPRIVALLDSLRGIHEITASSRNVPGGRLSAGTSFNGTWRSMPYSLTAEANDTGITYLVDAELGLPDWTRVYDFHYAFAEPLQLEPAPDVPLDFVDCAAMLMLRVPLGSSRVEAHVGSLSTFRAYAGTPTTDVVPILVPTERDVDLDGSVDPVQVTVSVTVGSDSAVDTVTFQRVIVLTPGCDDVIEIDCTGPESPTSPGTCALGEIRGRLDVVGEDECPSSRVTATGPWSNVRSVTIPATPSEGAYLLPNLVPSVVVSPPIGWNVRASTIMRRGWRRASLAFTQPQQVFLECGEEADADDALVVVPGFAGGEVRLFAPPWPGRATSAFDTLVRAPETGASECEGAPAGIDVRIHGRGVSGNGSTGVAGEVLREGTELRGDFELVLGAPPGAVSTWMPETLDFEFDDAGVAGAPATRVVADLEIGRWDVETWRVDPGAHVDVHHAHCFGIVELEILSTGGPFTSPSASAHGHLRGVDFEGVERNWRYEMFARGSVVSSAPPRGLVMLPLPEGEYTLRARVSMSGSSFDLVPLDVVVRCRQVSVLSSELQVQVAPVPSCRESGLVRVTGRVTGVDPVDSIVVACGGRSVVACTGCGDAPDFDVVLWAEAEEPIVATATDASGRVASAQAVSLEALEPSALDVRPTSTPLRVTKDGDGLSLSLEPGAAANVYRGTIAALGESRYDHRGIGACGVDGEVTLPGESGSFYFLASGRCDWGDGSLGRDTLGRERPPALERCVR